MSNKRIPKKYNETATATETEEVSRKSKTYSNVDVTIRLNQNVCDFYNFFRMVSVLFLVSSLSVTLVTAAHLNAIEKKKKQIIQNHSELMMRTIFFYSLFQDIRSMNDIHLVLFHLILTFLYYFHFYFRFNAKIALRIAAVVIDNKQLRLQKKKKRE